MKLLKDFSHQLKTLRKELNADFAIISLIKGTDYKVLAIDSELNLISEGDQFETKNTYCNEVINKKCTITYNNVGSMSEMINHPIYTTIQLEAYIGEPLYKNGNIVGTLNFSGFNKKHPHFTQEEQEQLQNLAREVEQALS